MYVDVECAICNRLCDEWAVRYYDGNIYFVCFDCDEKFTYEQITEHLEKLDRES